MKKFFDEFRTFISRGNVMDMAVGVIVGGMFTKIVTCFTNDILMPFVSLLTGRTNFTNMFFVLNGDGTTYTTLEEATAAGVSVVAYGNLIQLILDFLLTAFVLFLLVKGLNSLRVMSEKEAEKVKKKLQKNDGTEAEAAEEDKAE